MARWARCELDDVLVAGETGGRRLARGAEVDLDERVAPGLTLGEALGNLRRYFTPLTTSQPRWTGLPDED
jgi:hypothetical protein